MAGLSCSPRPRSSLCRGDAPGPPCCGSVSGSDDGDQAIKPVTAVPQHLSPLLRSRFVSARISPLEMVAVLQLFVRLLGAAHAEVPYRLASAPLVSRKRLGWWLVRLFVFKLYLFHPILIAQNTKP